VDAKQFEACIMTWTSSLRTLVNNEFAAIDGKQLSRSYDQSYGVHALQLVSAWVTESGLLLGQRRLGSLAQYSRQTKLRHD
jgi:hypothetical protein